MYFRFTKIAALLLLIDGARVSYCFADDRGQSQQFFNTYCISCHGKEKSKGGLRLHQFGEQQWNDPSLLNEIYQVIEFGEMPPEDAKKLPKPDQVKSLQEVLGKQLHVLAEKQKPVHAQAIESGGVPEHDQ